MIHCILILDFLWPPKFSGASRNGSSLTLLHFPYISTTAYRSEGILFYVHTYLYMHYILYAPLHYQMGNYMIYLLAMRNTCFLLQTMYKLSDPFSLSIKQNIPTMSPFLKRLISTRVLLIYTNIHIHIDIHITCTCYIRIYTH